jgi:hypothetical protein
MLATRWGRNVGNVGTCISLRDIMQDCQHSSFTPNLGNFWESWQLPTFYEA